MIMTTPNQTATLKISADLHHRLKVGAAQSGLKLQDFAGNLLDRALPKPQPFRGLRIRKGERV